MQNSLHKIIILVLFIFVTSFIFAQNSENLENKNIDTISKKESRKETRKDKKVDLKASNERFKITGTSVFANLSTTVSFQLPPNGNLSANISLEDDFGLDNRKSFFVGSALLFITPRSGLYAQ